MTEWWVWHSMPHRKLEEFAKADYVSKVTWNLGDYRITRWNLEVHLEHFIVAAIIVLANKVTQVISAQPSQNACTLSWRTTIMRGVRSNSAFQIFFRQKVGCSHVCETQINIVEALSIFDRCFSLCDPVDNSSEHGAVPKLSKRFCLQQVHLRLGSLEAIGDRNVGGAGRRDERILFPVVGAVYSFCPSRDEMTRTSIMGRGFAC